MYAFTQTLCVVVVGNTLAEFLTALDQTQQQTDWIELRVDFIMHLCLEDITTIKNKTHKKAIFCCRATTEGGQFLGDRNSQRAFLQKANDLGFDYLDIDLDIANDIKIKNLQSKIILSYHNYQITPSVDELKNLHCAMQKFHPYAYKFALTTNSSDDSRILIEFLAKKTKNEKWIVLGMGQHGKKLRLIAPLLDAYLTFASIGESTSAPGQMEFSLLQALYQNIEHLLNKS